MDMKRCAYCQKQVRVDVQTCDRCGHSFIQRRQRTSSGGTTRRSVPPASPHRAGHYSGLHPEDQPYYSTMMSVQRPAVRKSDPRLVARQESHDMLLSDAATVPMPDVEEQVLPPAEPDIAIPPPYRRQRPPQRRTIPIILTVSCLFLLISGSLLAYISLNKKPVLPVVKPTLTAIPNVLRTGDTFTLTGSDFEANDQVSFTRNSGTVLVDGNGKPLQVRTDGAGIFSVQIPAPQSWGIGQQTLVATGKISHQSISVTITIQQAPPALPSLQLGDSNIDLGAEPPGVISNKSITLTNTGGGQLTWQASCDQPWLTITPNSGTFSGSAVATVVVNRGTLTPQTYTGNILFTQQENSNQPLTLSVSMAVSAAPSSLAVLTGPLTYSASTTQNPPDQTITFCSF